ncbi:hypothetical protein [Mycobacterium sp. HM-7]
MSDIDDRERGLYAKYSIYRNTDAGRAIVPLTDPAFVLRYTTDPHAAVALGAYANSCEADYPKLAADLRDALRGQPECECVEPACQWCDIHGETGNRDDEDQDDTDWTHSTGNEVR